MADWGTAGEVADKQETQSWLRKPAQGQETLIRYVKANDRAQGAADVGKNTTATFDPKCKRSTFRNAAVGGWHTTDYGTAEKMGLPTTRKSCV